jgi:2-keto-4-pentenoate hydratase/2-oxohepta-3-ene-1,7-dioic acid hydratase in catechol pathway
MVLARSNRLGQCFASRISKREEAAQVLAENIMSASYAIAIAPRPSIAISGSDLLFPVRRIYCIGRNYAAHAREMGADPTREPPFFFKKRATRSRLVPKAKWWITPIRR